MFAHKSGIEVVYRVLLIAAIVFNGLVSTTVSASSQGEVEKSPPITNPNNELASSITLGAPDSQYHEQVPILSEQIANQAQQQKEFI